MTKIVVEGRFRDRKLLADLQDGQVACEIEIFSQKRFAPRFVREGAYVAIGRNCTLRGILGFGTHFGLETDPKYPVGKVVLRKYRSLNQVFAQEIIPDRPFLQHMSDYRANYVANRA